jgi:ABC-type transporter Mla subunit MlaD
VASLENFGNEASETARQARESIDVLVEKVNTTVDNTNQHMDKVARRVTDNLDSLSQLLDYLNSAGRDLAEGNGTLGMLLRDARFYDSLLLTVERLGQAASELKVLVIQWQRKGLMSGVQG